MSASPRTACFVLLALCLLLFAVPEAALAQVTSGSVFGTVTDPTGAAIPGAKVTITNVNTNTSSEVTTNEDGNFSRGQLIAGTYRVEVEGQGFRKSVNQSVNVSVDVGTRTDFRLEVGDVSQSVEVTAEAPLLRADRAEVNTLLTSKQIIELPVFNRNLQQLQLLTPGTQQLSWQHASSENPQGAVQIQVNGQHFSGTDYQLDGTSNQDPILGIIVINPTIDSVTEVKTATQNYDAEYGLAAAGVQTYTTKSGTNEVHGSLFHFGRYNTPGFQSFARNPFESAENTSVPPVKWNQFGGSIGGAAIQNKLFFFGDAQITRRRTGSSITTSVPTALARTGNFSEYLQGGRNQIYDPNTGDPATGLGRTPFVNNIIPTNRLSPQAQRLLQNIPLPNTVSDPARPFFRNYSTQGSENFDSEQWNTRGDWFINESSSIFARYSHANYRKFAPGAYGLLVGGPALNNIGFAGTSDVGNRSLAVGYNKTLSPTLITEVRFGYMQYRVDVLPNGLGTTPAADAGIPGLNSIPGVNQDALFTSGMPAFFIDGGDDRGGFNFGYGLGVNQCNCPLAQDEKQYQIVSNTTKIFGNHSVKFGADYRRALNLRVPSDRHRSGELTFSPDYTSTVTAVGAAPVNGLGLATFLLGQTTFFSRYVSPNTDARERQNRFFLYAQDTWRVTSKLQLNYGLRWEMIFPETVNEPGNGGQLDLRTGEIAVAGIGPVPLNMIQEMKWSNFAPRLGVTYQLTPRTVVRAGYGWGYALGTFGSIFGHNVTQNLPVLAIQEINRPNAFSGVFTLAQGPTPPVFQQPNPQTGRFLLPNGVNGKARPLNVRLPRSMAYNLTVQHQFGKDWSVDVGYVGNVGRHVFAGDGPDLNVNQAAFVPGVADENIRKPFFQRFGWAQGIAFYCNCATNQYDSLQANLIKRFSYGLNFQLSYTYQDADGDSGDSYTFFYNRPLGRGNRDNFARHTVAAPVNYEIPFGRGRRFGANSNRVVDILLGGWGLNGITYYRSGFPFTPNIDNLPGGTIRPNAGPAGRPDLGPGDPYEGAAGDRTQFFRGVPFGSNGQSNFNDPSSPFLLPANNTFGNLPINSLFGPKYINQDLTAAKRFAFTESVSFQIRAEAFNVFNHTNLGQPNGNITSTNAGQITGLASGATLRRFQFGARIDF